MDHKEILSFALKGVQAEKASRKDMLNAIAAQAFLSYEHPNAKVLAERVKEIQDDIVKLFEKEGFIVREINLLD